MVSQLVLVWRSMQYLHLLLHLISLLMRITFIMDHLFFLVWSGMVRNLTSACAILHFLGLWRKQDRKLLAAELLRRWFVQAEKWLSFLVLLRIVLHWSILLGGLLQWLGRN